jgi:hypothetical protein
VDASHEGHFDLPIQPGLLPDRYINVSGSLGARRGYRGARGRGPGAGAYME